MTASTPTSLGAAAPGGGAVVTRPKGAGRGRRAPRSQRLARIIVLVLVLGYLVVPLFAMLEFSTRGAVDPITKATSRSR